MTNPPDANAINIARDIARMRRTSTDQARASQAARRSVELNNTEGVSYYRDGKKVATIGATSEGDVVIKRDATVSPVPPIPSAPSVEAKLGGVAVLWDGLFTNGIWNEGLARVEVHRLDAEGLPVSDATQIGTFTSPMGGALFHAVDASAGPKVYVFHSVSVAEVESPLSGTMTATALPVVDAAMWQEHEDALEGLAVTLPALQADLDANSGAIENLTTVTLPALEGDLADNAAALATLRDFTVPDAVATADAAAAAAAAAAEQAAAAQAAADGAIRTFGPEDYPNNPPWANGSSQPANVIGDLWLNAAGVAHRWNGTTWYPIPDEAAASALAIATASQALAQAAVEDVDLLAGRVTTAEGSIGSVVTRVETAEGNITTVQSDITTLEGGVSSHETRLDTAEGQITTVEGRVTTAEADISSVETRMGGVEGDVSDITTIVLGKSKVTYSSSDPGATPNTIGDTWFRVVSGEVTGVWSGNGGMSWTQQVYTGAVLAHLDAGTITTGVLAAARIAANSIDTSKITTAGLDAATIKFGTMSGDRIEAGSLTIGKVGGLQNALDFQASKGTDLVPNGTGSLGNNTGFSEWTYDGTDAPIGARGSFDSPLALHGAINIDGSFAVDPNKTYALSFAAKQKGSNASNPVFYAYLYPQDAYGNGIVPDNYMYRAGTTTTLAAPLNPGDTTITLSDTTENWNTTADSFWRTITFWDYVDAGGKQWPIETYSRNIHYGVYPQNGPSGNTITLSQPWSGPAKPAGTVLSNTNFGGTFMYSSAAGVTISETEWVTFSDTITGVTLDGQGASFQRGFPPGTASTRIGFLTNYANPAGSQHSVALVSFSDATGATLLAKRAKDAADQAQGDAIDAGNYADAAYQRWAPSGQTTIDGGKITADSITAAQIAARSISSEELTIGALGVGDNLLVNGDFTEGLANWTNNGVATFAHVVIGRDWALVTTGATEGSVYQFGDSGEIPAHRGQQYYIEATVAGDGVAAMSWQPLLYCYDRDGNYITGVYPVDGTVLQGDVDGHGNRRGAVIEVPDDSSIYYVRTALLFKTPNRYCYVRDVSMNRVTPSVRIADGAVIAEKIAADAVTANKIAADAVTANKIAADAVTAVKIQADAVTAGKIAADAVGAREIQAQSITAAEIAADTITGNQIAAGSISAEEINADVLRAGFVLTGSIQVGQATWNPMEGLIIPQPNGARIHLPADGVTPASLGGHANLDSATIKGNFNLLGISNKVSGELKLANGIVEPTIAPSLSPIWPSTYHADLDGSSVGWRLYTGMCEHHSNADWIVTALNYGTAALRIVNRNTGAFVSQFTIPQTGSSAITVLGVGYYSGHYYAYISDAGRGNNYFIYKIRASDWVKVGEVAVGSGTSNDGPFRHWDSWPAFAVDRNNGTLMLAFIRRGTSLVNFERWDANLGAYYRNNDHYDIGGVYNFNGAHLGTTDMGEWALWLSVEETRNILYFAVSTLQPWGPNMFSAANNSAIRGLMFHYGINRFISLSRDGRLYTYSGHKVPTAVTASYTWYDSAGTVRETREGPVTSYTIPSRAYVNVIAGVPPDSGVTDAGQVDKANRIGIYVGVGAGGRKLQSYLGVDGSGVSQRSLWLDAIATGTANPPASNTFIGGTTSPGKITSGAEASGSPLLEISGDGSAKFNALTLRGTVMPRIQAGKVVGSFPNAASATVVVAFPQAFTAVPVVTATGADSNSAYYVVFVAGISATQVTFRLTTTNGGAVPYGFELHWIAAGT